MKSKQPIGAQQQNQSVICGIGNVYRAEVLFAAGIHPSRAGSNLYQSELEALWAITVAARPLLAKRHAHRLGRTRRLPLLLLLHLPAPLISRRASAGRRGRRATNETVV